MTFQDTAAGQTVSVTESYTTVYASPTTFKITLTSAVSGQGSTTSTVYILRNGTAIAVDVQGQNITGLYSSDILLSEFAGFSAEIGYGNQLGIFTGASYFHSTGTSSVTIGPTTFTVTNWAANNIPETLSSCTTNQETLSAYSLSEGIPKGSTYPLVTSMNLAGTDSTGSTFDYVITLTSITVA